jgi:AraC-like DNA-binding protein
MPLQNFEMHRSCFCYDGADSAAKLRGLPKGDVGSIDIHTKEVLFIVKGKINLQVNRQYELTLDAGEFIFLVAGSTMIYDALEESETLSIRIHDDVPECHIFQVDKVAGRMKDIYDGIYPLRLNERTGSFLATLLETYSDGLRCRHYLQMEASRMLFLIHAYYPQEECLKFFAQILSPDVKFSDFVRNNWMNCSTVKELADGIFMTTQQFTNRFKKVFGTTPYEWMTQQKAMKIYQDICRSDMPLKEISERYEFSSQTNFFHFCKHMFGRTPGQIRKSLKCDVEYQKTA